jgi:hypothetical protein
MGTVVVPAAFGLIGGWGGGGKIMHLHRSLKALERATDRQEQARLDARGGAAVAGGGGGRGGAGARRGPGGAGVARCHRAPAQATARAGRALRHHAGHAPRARQLPLPGPEARRHAAPRARHPPRPLR